MGIRALVIVMLVACSAIGQSPSRGATESRPADLQDELSKLAADAELLHSDLPGFACTETGTSQAIKENERNPNKNKVKAQVQFVAGVRAERSGEGRLHESLTLSEVNGKPYNGGKFTPPMMVEGGFDQLLDIFLPERQTCFDFRLSEGRIDFVSKPGTFDRKQCGELGAPEGYIRFDAAGNVSHMERQVTPELARQVHIVDFASADIVSTELDGKMYPLPAKVVAEVPKDGEVLHFEAAYTACHLFKATSTILPGTAPDTGDAPGAPHP